MVKGKEMTILANELAADEQYYIGSANESKSRLHVPSPPLRCPEQWAGRRCELLDAVGVRADYLRMYPSATLRRPDAFS